MFKDKLYYNYKGKYNLEDIINFLNTSHTLQNGLPIPQEKGWNEHFRSFGNMTVKGYLKIFDKLGLTSLPAKVKIILIILFIVIPIITIVMCMNLLWKHYVLPNPQKPTKEKTKNE